MNIRELHTFFEAAPTIYKVENSEIIEYKVAVFDGKPDVDDIENSSFCVGFKQPKGWRPEYALPYIIVEGVRNDGKLYLSTPQKKGGYDLPGAYFGVEGDFYINKDSAYSAL